MERDRDNEILDTNLDKLDEKREEYKCIKLTVKEKLRSIFFVLIVWIPMFVLMESFFLSEEGHLIRSLFYSGAVLGYILYVLFNPIYKKI